MTYHCYYCRALTGNVFEGHPCCNRCHMELAGVKYGAKNTGVAANAAAIASTFEPGYSPDDEAREARERRP